MNRTDKVIFGFIFGASFPILFSLVGLTIGFYFYKEECIKYLFSGGLLTGIIVDILFLKRLIPNIFDLSFRIIAGFYVFYNIIIYGMFMGFPVFNLLMGIAGGYYAGKRIINNNIGSPQREIIIKKVSGFSALIMMLICFSSAFLAISEKTIGLELQNMLGLDFIVTKGMIIGIILIGGISLIIIQYYLTRFTIIKTLS